MRFTRRYWILLAKVALCSAVLIFAAGCGSTRWGKKASVLSNLLEMNGFSEKETVFTLIGDHEPPNNRLLLTEKKLIWRSLREAYSVNSFRDDDFYDIELKAGSKVAHLYVRNHDNCALFLRDLPADHPDFSKNNPRYYFISPGLMHIIIAETSKAPVAPQGTEKK